MAVIDRQAAKAAGYTDAQIDKFERENGLTPTSSVASQPQPQPSAPSSTTLTPSQVATGAVLNFPKSFGSMVGDVYEAVTSPVETIKSVLDIGAGTLQNLLPDKVVDFVGRDQASIDKANLVKQFYVNRYGNLENAKQALTNDPASVLSDLSLFLTGGAGLAPKASTASKVLTTAAKVTDPLSIITSPVKLGAQALAPSLGMMTGAGSEAVRQAFEAGKEGGVKGKSFTENLRGTADQLQVLEDAKANLDAMTKQQQQAYRANMANIKTDQTILKFDDVNTALQNAMDKITYKGKVKSQYALDKVQEAQKIIDDWKN